MARGAETALLGWQHPLHDEISALAIAVASPETPEKIGLARKALAERSNEHALLDAAGIIGFFATITILVDFTGHSSQEFVKMFQRMAKIIATGRRIRCMIGKCLGW